MGTRFDDRTQISMNAGSGIEVGKCASEKSAWLRARGEGRHSPTERFGGEGVRSANFKLRISISPER